MRNGSLLQLGTVAVVDDDVALVHGAVAVHEAVVVVD